MRFLDSAASQTKVFLTKTDYFSLAVFHTFKGTMYYNFFDYANMRLHQVSVNHLQPFSYYQYIEVIFTLDPKYFPHEGGLVALNSVLIAQGTFSNLISGPVHYPNASQNWTEDHVWYPACHTNNYGAIWDNNETRMKYASALAQDCSPHPKMCHNNPTITQQAAVFHIPLGEQFFNPLFHADPFLAFSIFADLIVKVVETLPGVEKTQKQWYTRLLGQIPVAGANVNVHCDAMQLEALLRSGHA